MSFNCLQTQVTKKSLHSLSQARTQSLAKAAHSTTPSKTLQQYRTAVKEGHSLDIPSPSIFNFEPTEKDNGASSARLPSPAECATHLELLQTFHVLRQRVLASEKIDKSFDIHPNRITKRGRKGTTKTLKDETLLDRRQIKWKRYVEFAVIRFLRWKEALPVEDAGIGTIPVLERLPPLDVLMVWHAFLLNPRLFQQHCEDEPLYRVKIPWEAVHASIRHMEWDYTQEEIVELQFEIDTGLPAHLFQTFESWGPYSESASLQSARYLTAYSLSLKVAPHEQEILEDGVFLESKRSVFTPRQQAVADKHLSVAGEYARLFRKYTGPEVATNLATQLRDAVIRQCDFVEKMDEKLWVRSPALPGTLRRAIDRYGKFLGLIRLNPDMMVVPTLDIDLVWHTHQCSGASYTYDMLELTGQFVNHDDKLGKPVLGSGMAETKRLYRIHYGEDYRHCGCWECETLLDHVEEVVKQALITGEEDFDMGAIAQIVAEEVGLYRTIELATRTRNREE
jgi:hypothetical protein